MACSLPRWRGLPLECSLWCVLRLLQVRKQLGDDLTKILIQLLTSSFLKKHLCECLIQDYSQVFFMGWLECNCMDTFPAMKEIQCKNLVSYFECLWQNWTFFPVWNSLQVQLLKPTFKSLYIQCHFLVCLVESYLFSDCVFSTNALLHDGCLSCLNKVFSVWI